MRFAFALTQSADVPGEDEIESAYEELWPEQPMTGTFQVGAIPTPVPEGEAEHAAAFSIASLGNARALEPHSAHLVLIYTPADDLNAVAELQAFTRVMAALLVASRAQAVYWGDAGASHPAGFFVEVAQNVELPLPLWSGVSRWKMPDGRLGLLSLGMSQLELLDLLVTAPHEEAAGSARLLLRPADLRGRARLGPAEPAKPPDARRTSNSRSITGPRPTTRRSRSSASTCRDAQGPGSDRTGCR